MDGLPDLDRFKKFFRADAAVLSLIEFAKQFSERAELIFAQNRPFVGDNTGMSVLLSKTIKSHEFPEHAIPKGVPIPPTRDIQTLYHERTAHVDCYNKTSIQSFTHAFIMIRPKRILLMSPSLSLSLCHGLTLNAIAVSLLITLAGFTIESDTLSQKLLTLTDRTMFLVLGSLSTGLDLFWRKSCEFHDVASSMYGYFAANQ